MSNFVSVLNSFPFHFEKQDVGGCFDPIVTVVVTAGTEESMRQDTQLKWLQKMMGNVWEVLVQKCSSSFGGKNLNLFPDLWCKLTMLAQIYILYIY